MKKLKILQFWGKAIKIVTHYYVRDVIFCFNLFLSLVSFTTLYVEMRVDLKINTKGHTHFHSSELLRVPAYSVIDIIIHNKNISKINVCDVNSAL